MNEETFIDSDEEVENIMQALKYSKPVPLAQKPFFFVKRRRQCFRLRDILLDAITPKSIDLHGLDNSVRQQQQGYFQQPQPHQHQQQQQQSFVPNGNNNSILGGDMNSIFG